MVCLRNVGAALGCGVLSFPFYLLILMLASCQGEGSSVSNEALSEASVWRFPAGNESVVDEGVRTWVVERSEPNEDGVSELVIFARDAEGLELYRGELTVDVALSTEAAADATGVSGATHLGSAIQAMTFSYGADHERTNEDLALLEQVAVLRAYVYDSLAAGQQGEIELVSEPDGMSAPGISNGLPSGSVLGAHASFKYAVVPLTEGSLPTNGSCFAKALTTNFAKGVDALYCKLESSPSDPRDTPAYESPGGSLTGAWQKLMSDLQEPADTSPVPPSDEDPCRSQIEAFNAAHQNSYACCDAPEQADPQVCECDPETNECEACIEGPCTCADDELWSTREAACVPNAGEVCEEATPAVEPEVEGGGSAGGISCTTKVLDYWRRGPGTGDSSECSRGYTKFPYRYTNCRACNLDGTVVHYCDRVRETRTICLESDYYAPNDRSPSYETYREAWNCDRDLPRDCPDSLQLCDQNACSEEPGNCAQPL